MEDTSTPPTGLIKTHFMGLLCTGSPFYLLLNLYLLCFSETSSALLVLSSTTWRMLSVVVFCFMSVGDGSFQEEAEEGENMIPTLYVCVRLVALSCPTLCDPMDCSPKD